MPCKLVLNETKLVKSISAAGKLFQTLAVRCDKNCLREFFSQCSNVGLGCDVTVTFANNYLNFSSWTNRTAWSRRLGRSRAGTALAGKSVSQLSVSEIKTTPSPTARSIRLPSDAGSAQSCDARRQTVQSVNAPLTPALTVSIHYVSTGAGCAAWYEQRQ